MLIMNKERLASFDPEHVVAVAIQYDGTRYMVQATLIVHSFKLVVDLEDVTHIKADNLKDCVDKWSNTINYNAIQARKDKHHEARNFGPRYV